jgi:hypothetical protein
MVGVAARRSIDKIEKTSTIRPSTIPVFIFVRLKKNANRQLALSAAAGA